MVFSSSHDVRSLLPGKLSHKKSKRSRQTLPTYFVGVGCLPIPAFFFPFTLWTYAGPQR